MKKVVILIILAVLVLTACAQQATPTQTDSEMATKVAQILTNMPTATGQGPKEATTSTCLPTIALTATKPPADATQVASPTKAAPAATATLAPSDTPVPPTSTPEATATQPEATKTPSGPTATPVTGDPRNGLGNPTWTDNMDNGNNWPTGVDPAGYTTIDFNNGYMELTGLQSIDGWRLTHKSFANAYIEMTVNTGSCLPKDRYGLIARVPNAAKADRGYMFVFTCDGQFAIRKWDGPANVMTNLVNWKANAAIKSGANQTNRMGVMLVGSKLSLYANGVLVGEAQDSTWSEGVFGIFVGAHESSEYTVKVDSVSYWEQ
jgi:hypothetical protein